MGFFSLFFGPTDGDYTCKDCDGRGYLMEPEPEDPPGNWGGGSRGLYARPTQHCNRCHGSGTVAVKNGQVAGDQLQSTRSSRRL